MTNRLATAMLAFAAAGFCRRAAAAGAARNHPVLRWKRAVGPASRPGMRGRGRSDASMLLPTLGHCAARGKVQGRHGVGAFAGLPFAGIRLDKPVAVWNACAQQVNGSVPAAPLRPFPQHLKRKIVFLKD